MRTPTDRSRSKLHRNRRPDSTSASTREGEQSLPLFFWARPGRFMPGSGAKCKRGLNDNPPLLITTEGDIDMASDKLRVGFIGASGMMGHGMARNILAKGHPLTLTVHRNKEAVSDLLAGGASQVE